MKWVLNTSNAGKLAEFRQLFEAQGAHLESTHFDLPEIDADPVTVAVHKASQLPEGVLVDDTSLDVEGAEVGIHVRRLIEQLQGCVGHVALWRVLLACRRKDKVYVYEGRVKGTICEPRGAGGFGFDPFFMPEGSQFTLAEEKSRPTNARALAVDALLANNPVAIVPVLVEWKGAWQKYLGA